MKKNSRLIVTAAILAILLGWVLAKDRGRVPEKGEVFKLKTEQATALSVKTDAQNLVLQKQGEQWTLGEPVRGWADKDAAERAINAFARLKPTGSRQGVNLNDAKWGLDKPKLTAVLTYDGSRTATLYLGKQTADNSEYFARIEGKDRLYFVPASTYNDLTQAVDSLRDKSLVHLKKEDVKSLSLQYPDRVLTVQNSGAKDAPKWFLTQPYQAKADEFNVSQVAQKLVDMKADGFAPEQAAAGKNYGFDKPMLKATVVAQDGKTFLITFGAKGQEVTADASAGPNTPPSTSSKSVVYARVEGRPEVLLVADSNMTDLQKTDMDLRDKRILSIAKESVRQIKVERKQGVSFTAERSGPDAWRLTVPSTIKANKTKVEDLLWDMAELEAKEFLGEQQDFKQYGLALADTVITLTVAGESQPIKIYVGYKKTDGIYYARTSLNNQVYTIGETLVVDMPKTLDELKDTTPAGSETAPEAGGMPPGMPQGMPQGAPPPPPQ